MLCTNTSQPHEKLHFQCSLCDGYLVAGFSINYRAASQSLRLLFLVIAIGHHHHWPRSMKRQHPHFIFLMGYTGWSFKSIKHVFIIKLVLSEFHIFTFSYVVPFKVWRYDARLYKMLVIHTFTFILPAAPTTGCYLLYTEIEIFFGFLCFVVANVYKLYIMLHSHTHPGIVTYTGAIWSQYLNIIEVVWDRWRFTILAVNWTWDFVKWNIYYVILCPHIITKET